MSAGTPRGFGGPETGRDVTRYMRVELHETEPSADGAPRVVGTAPAADHLRGPDGGVRAGALLAILDSVGGLCGGLAALPDAWVVSTNMSARTLTREHRGPFRVEAGVLRKGRTSVVTGIEIRDSGARDAIVVDGVLTSALLVPQAGPPRWERPMSLPVAPPLPEPVPPLPEWMGARPIDGNTMEMPLPDALRNPWGILHGGVVVSLADLAAEHVTRRTTTDVVLHFLAPNRVGPVRATATELGRRSDGVVSRVEVREHGAGRVTALAVVTSA